MDNFLEKAKDILYNISDYLVMGAIILIIGIIIFWRLDIILPGNSSNIATEENNLPTEANKTLDRSKNDNLKNNSEEAKDTEPSKDEPIEEIKTVAITIPSGSPTSIIANILLDNHLIESIDDFEEKVYELDLEKSLRSGDYELKSDMPLENIIKTIANKI